MVTATGHVCLESLESPTILRRKILYYPLPRTRTANPPCHMSTTAHFGSFINYLPPFLLGKTM